MDPRRAARWPELLRARAIAANLVDGRWDVCVEVAVLAQTNLSAFSWPDGHLFLSRGLVASLNDDELAAAVAHEVGHLLKEPAAS